MTNYTIVERILAYFGLVRAVRRLGSTDPRKQSLAAEHLRAVGKRSWPLLRKKAFRISNLRALRAASLLYEIGDEQGLWALLSMHSTVPLIREVKDGVRDELERIGPQPIISTLAGALDQLDRGILLTSNRVLPRIASCLTLINSLSVRLTDDIWLRLLSLHISGMEGASTCKMVTPVSGDKRAMNRQYTEAYPVNASPVHLRRTSLEILLQRRPDNLFTILHRTLSCPDVNVQLTAIHGLWRLDDRQAIVLLQPIAANRQHPYSKEAKRAIESFGSAQPDEVTLVRASMAAPDIAGLLRPAACGAETRPELLLRSSVGEKDNN